jgi:hypothetical protein
MAGKARILIIEEKDNKVCVYRKGIESREEILEVLNKFISDFFNDEIMLINKESVKAQSTIY